MNDDLSSRFQDRHKILKNLDAILVCPVMEDGSEIVYVCTDRLLVEEVAVTLRSAQQIPPSKCSKPTHCSMKVTLSLSSVGSLAFPSATGAGRSCTVHLI